MPPEVIYAEVFLMEIQQAIGFFYASLVRFYLSCLKLTVLEQMREDLIEAVTSTVVSGDLSNLCLLICRLSTRQEEHDLKDKYNKYNTVQIHELGVNPWFTLNKTSKLINVIED